MTSSRDLSDITLADAIEALRDATAALRGVRDAVDWTDLVRSRLEAELVRLDDSVRELGSVLEDATNQLV